MRLSSLLLSTINFYSQRATLTFINHHKRCQQLKMYGFATIKSISTSTIKAPQIESIKYYEQ